MSADQRCRVAKAIGKRKATGISDGFFLNKRGTTACKIDTNHDIVSIIFALHDKPGNEIDQSPYRSELEEISTMLAILQCLYNYYNITKGSIILGLDGRSHGASHGKFTPILFTKIL